MKYLLIIFIFFTSYLVFAKPQAPFPIFLKSGFSSVLEFNASPSQIVIGDKRSFQIEKLNQSLAIRSNSDSAQSNMFVYFGNNEPYLFILTSSEDSDPTFYQKFDFPEVKKAPIKPKEKKALKKRFIGITSSSFDLKKDQLFIEVLFQADSSSKITPHWNDIRLSYQGKEIKPKKVSSERNIIQKDSSIKAQLTFLKPNLPRNLKGVLLNIPTLELKKISLKFPQGAK